MASKKTREQFRNEGINLWNSRCMKLIDNAEEMGLRLMDKGKDTESLVGMDLAIDLLVERDRIAALESHISQAREELAEARRLAQWTPITAENLPVEGDELLHADGSVKHFEAANPNIDEEWDAEDYNEWQWLWKRPIAPPTEAVEQGGRGVLVALPSVVPPGQSARARILVSPYTEMAL